jgi:hypothetical protein
MRWMLVAVCIAMSIRILVSRWPAVRAAGVLSSSLRRLADLVDDAAWRLEPDAAAHVPTFQPGDRVRVQGNPVGVTLQSPLGAVAGVDPRNGEGYYLVQLDHPATDWDTGEPVPVIVEAAFNLEAADARGRAER